MSTNNLAMPTYQEIGRAPRMTKGEVIGKNVVRLRTKAGLSVNRLAKDVGVKLNTIQQIEAGVTQKSKYLPDIARVLKVALSEIDPSQAADVKPEIENKPIPLGSVVGTRDVPVYATTEGGDGIMVMHSDPVDLTDRPSSIQHVKNAYAVIVTGDSMVPLLRPGSIVIVNPNLHPRRDDLCIFRVEEHGEFRSTVKEFVSKTTGGWRVRRYQPAEKEFLLKAEDWKECHVIVAIHRR